MSNTDTKTTELLERMKLFNSQNQDLGEQKIVSVEPLKQISTLAPNVFRPLSPMLNARFNYCSSWINAYHEQSWLSLNEIASATESQTIKQSLDLRMENWSWLPPGSVSPEDCAIFAHNPYDFDETYLVWTSSSEEPTIWCYLDADYKMFNNLNRYIEYIIGDRDIDDAIRETWNGEDIEG